MSDGYQQLIQLLNLSTGDNLSNDDLIKCYSILSTRLITLIDEILDNNKNYFDIKTYNKEQQELINIHQKSEILLKNMLQELIQYINKINTQVNVVLPAQGNIVCRHKDFCKSCNTIVKESEIYSFCYQCETCDYLSKNKTKYDNKMALDKMIKHLEINNNSFLNIKTNNFIQTKDRYFEVFIKNANIEDMKRIFIFYMCRAKAKQIFPNERTNLSLSYPLTAGIYSIKYNQDKPYLHGLLRYEYSTKTRMTENKLKDFAHDGTIIEVNIIVSVSHTISLEAIQSVVKSITEVPYFGSAINDFY